MKWEILSRIASWLPPRPGPTIEPETARRGRLGEQAACRYLQDQGFRFLLANYRSRYGEIDLILLDGPCLVFAEVKTRSSEAWARPAKAVNSAKKVRLTRTALAYLREIRTPRRAVRFDIVEVLLKEGRVREIRHLPDAFPFSRPWRYG